MAKKNKRAGITNITGYIVVFSFLSIVALTFAFLNVAIMNDYVFYEIQELIEDLRDVGMLNNNTVDLGQHIGDTFYNFNFHFDDLWFLVYIIFIISTLMLAYQTKRPNNFSFLTYLFYGVLALLFLVSIFERLTDWFNIEILIKLFPNVTILLPKFYYYIDHLGVINAIHIVVCIIINRLDFDFSKIINRKRMEDKTLDDSEVI